MRARSTAYALVAVAVCFSAFGVAPVVAGGPVTVRYPSVDCPDTGDEGLQQCIDSVEPGSTVVLVSEVIDEIAVIEKSLTLRAVDRSLQPVLAILSVRAQSGPGPVPTLDVTVQDIRFSLGVRINFFEGAGHSVTIRRVEVGKGAPTSFGMAFSTDVPASFTLERSFVRVDREDQVEALGLFANDPGGDVRFRIVGNRITGRGDTDGGAGIQLGVEGSGSVRADILNNVISDVATCNCGAASGIAVLPSGEIRAEVNIVGNTIDGSDTNAIQQRNDLTTGRLSLDVFNNIFSNHDSSALRLETGAPGTLVFRAGFNNFFANGSPNSLDGQSAGSGNLKLDPRYVNPVKRDLRLRSDSPLIDKGITCSPGGVANPEGAGGHRLNGPTVDIGAFELGAAAITGVVRLGTAGANELLGTPGRDILCGYGGPDVLRGSSGPDYIDAGPGPDRATGGPGVDRVLGNSGADVLCGRDGVGGDRLDGGQGTDRASTDSGDIRISIEGSASC